MEEIDYTLLTRGELYRAYDKALDEENDHAIEALEKEITDRYGTWFSPF